MIELNLNKRRKSLHQILCLGAHSDDLEIGCGGTILKIADIFPNLAITWVVFGSEGVRSDEAGQSANLFLKNVAEKRIIVNNYRDGFFPYIGGEIKDYFEQLKRGISPDIIFTHYRQDLHQDHRLISELTWNTFRNHMILEYEIPKYDGDFGSPNFFVHLNEQICREKIQYLFDVFKSQHGKHWFTEDTFQSLMRLRGVESSAPERYAEAFYCRKMVGFSPS